MKTTEKLARALENANAPITMIERARGGLYDDFLSTSGTPISDLVHDLRAAISRCLVGNDSVQAALLDAIVQAAINGEYDATKEEADAWAESAEGRKALGFLLPECDPRA